MALQISQKEGKFYLKGKLNNATSKFFIVYFQYNIAQYKNVTINIDSVDEISEEGLAAIGILTSLALEKNKLFSITGYGCKEIYDHFDGMDVA